MNMNRMRTVVWIIVTLAVIGCSAFTLSDTNKLTKGMSVEHVLGVVSKGPVDEFDINLPSDPRTTLHVLQFNLKNGGTSGDYYLVFKDDKLMYWGYPYEFNRYPDPTFNEIGAEVVKERD
jgi:hypothetical protein